MKITDQAKCDYLAKELMGWKKGIRGWYLIIDNSNPYNPKTRFIIKYHKWRPDLNAILCRDCVLKMGEIGLGREYVHVLLASLPGMAFGGDDWLDRYEKFLFSLVTLPLAIQVDAMIKVLKARDNSGVSTDNS